MGLDMQLNKKNKKTGELELIGYWRKANAIFEWIDFNVETINNMQELFMSEEDVKKLLAKCKDVLAWCKSDNATWEVKKTNVGAKIENGVFTPLIQEVKVMDARTASVLDAIMPTRQGYFFGSTLYDEGYMQDLADTITFCERVLAEVDFDTEDVVFWAWW